MKRLGAILAGALLGFAASAQSGPDTGSTIVGDQEAAIGLYLMPWREEPVSDLDRPPRRLELLPAPPEDVRAQAKTAETVDAFHRDQLRQR